MLCHFSRVITMMMLHFSPSVSVSRFVVLFVSLSSYYALPCCSFNLFSSAIVYMDAVTVFLWLFCREKQSISSDNTSILSLLIIIIECCRLYWWLATRNKAMQFLLSFICRLLVVTLFQRLMQERILPSRLPSQTTMFAHINRTTAAAKQDLGSSTTTCILIKSKHKHEWVGNIPFHVFFQKQNQNQHQQQDWTESVYGMNTLLTWPAFFLLCPVESSLVVISMFFFLFHPKYLAYHVRHYYPSRKVKNQQKEWDRRTNEVKKTTTNSNVCREK